MSTEWPASHRYLVASAPGGLGLVQDFLNTVAIGNYGPDLLTDTALAREWMAGAMAKWSALRGVDGEAPGLDDGDLSKLRALRGAIAEMVAGEATFGRATNSIRGFNTSFALSDTGEVRLEPAGSGWRWLASLLWGEIFLSQQHDTWRRIKRCHNHHCGSTFYDRSKNNSGVWHDVKTCGNAANLRASRARRRDREHAAEEPK